MAYKKSRRKDDRYMISVTLGKGEDGKRIRKYFYGDTQREAREKRDAFLKGIKPAKEMSRMTLEKWSQIWLESYATGGVRNRANNQSIIKRFIDYIGDKGIEDIKPADIQSYAKTQSRFTKSHVDKVRRTLSNLFDSAVANNYLTSSPIKGIVWDYIKTGTHIMLSHDLIELVTDYWKVHQAGIWAMLMLYAGLRPSEAFALTRENIKEDRIIVTDGSHFEGGRLIITKNQVKTEAGQREIPIVPPLRPVIEAIPEEGLVCRSASGNGVSQAAARSGWKCLWSMLEELYNGRVPHKSGRRSDIYPEDWKYLPKVQMYDLRHTYCSMLYEADVDVKTAQYLMGHATLEMTLKIYTHLSEQKKKRSYDKLMEYFE